LSRFAKKRQILLLLAAWGRWIVPGGQCGQWCRCAIWKWILPTQLKPLVGFPVRRH